MMDFELHKKNILSKDDKSRKGSWDEKIAGLCNKLNSIPEYCTTSSCSGRLLVTKPGIRKHETKYLFVTHDIVKINDIIGYIQSPIEGSVIQVQSAILHVACKTLDSALLLMQKARDNGFRRSGIISINPIVVEIVSDNTIHYPLLPECNSHSNQLADSIAIKANELLRITWTHIRKLEESL